MLQIDERCRTRNLYWHSPPPPHPHMIKEYSTPVSTKDDIVLWIKKYETKTFTEGDIRVASLGPYKRNNDTFCRQLDFNETFKHDNHIRM